MKVAFYKGKRRLFNKLTSWYLRGEYSHVEIILEEQEEYSLCLSSSFMDDGVRVKSIKLDLDMWDIIEVQVQPEKVQKWIDLNLGKKYDTLGIMSFISRVFKVDKNKYYCSEAVAEALGFSEAWRYDPCILYSACKRYSTG